MENETKNLMLWIEAHKENLASYMPQENIVHQAVWGSRVMDNLTKGVKLGSVAAIDLACELIAQDQKYAFGKIIKSNLARALKGQSEYINREQQRAIVRTTRKLLEMEYTPRETEDYCRLVTHFKEIDLAVELAGVKACSTSAERWLVYLRESANKPLNQDAQTPDAC